MLVYHDINNLFYYHFTLKIHNFTPILIEINIPDSTYSVNMTTITLSRWRRVFRHRDNLPTCSFGNINIFKSTHCLFLDVSIDLKIA